MIKTTTLLSLFVVLTATIHSQSSNSLLNNYDFETTNWQSIGWVSQTNTGNAIIANQNEPFFDKQNIVANSGMYFAYIGGYQDPAGLYEGEIAQEFFVGTAGHAKLDFYVRYISPSVDPGSEISISLDGTVIWSINPHYIVNSSATYEQIILPLGHIDAGNHTISIHGYENPMGGDMPMKFVFDDLQFKVLETASIEDESNVGLNIITTPGNIQINTTTELNEEATIELLDLSGKVVATSVTYFQNSYMLPVTSLNGGLYILNIKTATQQFSRKLFINS